jgi:heat shock protein HspQ
MEFKVGDKVQHKTYPMWGIIVEIITGKETTYKVSIEVGYLIAKKEDLILAK